MLAMCQPRDHRLARPGRRRTRLPATNSSAAGRAGAPWMRKSSTSTPVRPRCIGADAGAWAEGVAQGGFEAAGGQVRAAEHEQHECGGGEQIQCCRVTAAIVAGRACSRRIGGMPFTTLAGIDFTSRPTRRKPITVAIGQSDDAGVRLRGSTATCRSRASRPGCARRGHGWAPSTSPSACRASWSNAGLAAQWLALMEFYASLSREQIRATFAAFCDARPVGLRSSRNRACDLPAGSSPSMKWVNRRWPYAAAGVPLLIAAGVHTACAARG